MARASGDAACGWCPGYGTASRRAESEHAVTRPLVDAFHHGFLKPVEWTHVAYAVPRVSRVGRLPLGFIALQETGHEKLARQRRQPHTTSLTVSHDACRFV